MNISLAPHFLGIDLGTGGVRAVAINETGEVVASSNISFPPNHHTLPAGHHEQDAEDWWRATQQAVTSVVESLRGKRISAEAIAAIAVDGTSGTVVGVNASGRPVTPGLMYNDGRAVAEARELAGIAETAGPSPAGKIAASYAISKIRWLEQHAQEQFASVRWFAHQADYIAARLTGRWGVSDYSNALKTGYDLLSDCWPAWLESSFPEIRLRLPEIVAPGSEIGIVSSDAAAELGLSSRTRVIAGATDGTAGFLASGANRIGDDNTTLGTTLVFKRLAAAPCLDSRGLIYCHKLPGGMWLPGAAGNTGCEWMSQRYSNADFQILDQQALSSLPCPILAYPLARTGERFPFLSPSATGFCDAASTSVVEYAAHLQGVALVERMCYETLDAATDSTGSADLRGDTFATGGGSRSDIWMQLRADVNGRIYHRPAYPESAFGVAVLAASSDRTESNGKSGLWSAIRDMVRIERTFYPDESRKIAYDSLYTQFQTRLRERLGDLT